MAKVDDFSVGEVVYNSQELSYYDQLHSEKYRDIGQTFKQHCAISANYLFEDGVINNDLPIGRMYDMLLNRRFLPAGRVQAAIGATQREVSAFNCSVSQTIEDSMDSIMSALSNAAKILRLGTGIGYNFSNLRPKGAPIKKLGTESSGPLSFMKIFDVMASTIASSGHRRGAQMGIMDCDHPDIEEFIDAKMTKDAYRQFNLSVAVTDEFMKAVREDKNWDLVFGGKTYKTISAKYLWHKIMQNAYNSAEPGIVFPDRWNQTNNLWYCERIDATNPCVSGDTEILTKNGNIRIDELVGKSVDVWNGKNWSTVIPRVTGEDQDILIVAFDNGNKIECTPYHTFILKNGEKKKAKDLVKGDTVKSANYPVVSGHINVVDAYRNGFYQGDGWQDQRGRQWIALYGEKKELIDYLIGTTYSEYAVQGGYEGTDTSQTKYMFRVYNMPNKGYVPNADWNVESRLRWFAGLCDSDGTCAHSEDSIEIQISNKEYEFIRKVSLMLNTLGVFSRISPMNDVWRLSVKSSEVFKLQKLGLHTLRLNLEDNNPKYNVQNKIKVTGVFKRSYKEEKVYCFDEPVLHQGVFNGVLTGQCSEQPLPPYGLCLLGSFNLPAYISKDKQGFVNFDRRRFKQDIILTVAAYDNIFEKSIYAISEHKIEAQSKRRMGLGLTGVSTAIEYYLGKASYGSDSFCEIFKDVASELTHTAYRASIDIAKRKGAFSEFRAEYSKSEFIKTLPQDIQEDISKYGIRNSHLISYAPCGTISQTAGNISSGIEPIFHHRMKRDVHMKDGKINITLQDYNVRNSSLEGRTLEQCSISDHMRVGSIAQQYCDSAVSKTVNVAKNCTFDDYKGIYENAHEIGLKGITVYRPTELRGAVIVNADETKCKDGVCEM